MSKYFIAVVLTLLLGVSSFAGNKHRYELSDELVSYVQMSDSQRAQIQVLRNSIQEQKQELKAMEKADRHSAKSGMKEQYRADLKGILSKDQLAKYDEFRHMNKQKNRKHKKGKENAKEKNEVM